MKLWCNIVLESETNKHTATGRPLRKADQPERPTVTLGWSLQLPRGIINNGVFLVVVLWSADQGGMAGEVCLNYLFPGSTYFSPQSEQYWLIVSTIEGSTLGGTTCLHPVRITRIRLPRFVPRVELPRHPFCDR